MNRVKEMLESHDIAEGITGDVPRHEKRPGHHDEEVKLIWRLAWIGGLFDPPLRWHNKALLFMEFCEGESLEARTARDIDRLDLVLRAMRYLSSGVNGLQEAGMQEMIQTVGDEIETQHVRDLLLKADILSRPYEPAFNISRKYLEEAT